MFDMFDKIWKPVYPQKAWYETKTNELDGLPRDGPFALKINDMNLWERAP